jgi:hypothetical protein
MTKRDWEDWIGFLLDWILGMEGFDAAEVLGVNKTGRAVVSTARHGFFFKPAFILLILYALSCDICFFRLV